jgi:hypothetical protein
MISPLAVLPGAFRAGKARQALLDINYLIYDQKTS